MFGGKNRPGFIFTKISSKDDKSESRKSLQIISLFTSVSPKCRTEKEVLYPKLDKNKLVFFLNL